MPNYCTLSIEKIKSFENMNSRFEHNHRLREVLNADPERILDNYILLNREEQTYQELYKEAIDTEYYRRPDSSKIRKDAVKGIEVVMSFSHGADEDIDMDTWQLDCLNFLADKFGGPENIVDAVIHYDETTPHMHAFIIPMTRDGRLCAKEFINGRKDLVKLQDDYAKAMAKHGLVRGAKGSFMKHNDVREFYADLKEAVNAELPAPEEGENIRTYYERANETYKKAIAQKLKEKQEAERALNERYTARIAKYAGLDDFLKEAREKFGSFEKAKKNLFEKHRLNLGLEAMEALNPQQHEEATQILDILYKGGEIIERDREEQKREKEQENRNDTAK